MKMKQILSAITACAVLASTAITGGLATLSASAVTPDLETGTSDADYDYYYFYVDVEEDDTITVTVDITSDDSSVTVGYGYWDNSASEWVDSNDEVSVSSGTATSTYTAEADCSLQVAIYWPAADYVDSVSYTLNSDSSSSSSSSNSSSSSSSGEVTPDLSTGESDADYNYYYFEVEVEEGDTITVYVDITSDDSSVTVGYGYWDNSASEWVDSNDEVSVSSGTATSTYTAEADCTLQVAIYWPAADYVDSVSYTLNSDSSSSSSSSNSSSSSSSGEVTPDLSTGESDADYNYYYFEVEVEEGDTITVYVDITSDDSSVTVGYGYWDNSASEWVDSNDEASVSNGTGTSTYTAEADCTLQVAIYWPAADYVDSVSYTLNSDSSSSTTAATTTKATTTTTQSTTTTSSSSSSNGSSATTDADVTWTLGDDTIYEADATISYPIYISDALDSAYGLSGALDVTDILSASTLSEFTVGEVYDFANGASNVENDDYAAFAFADGEAQDANDSDGTIAYLTLTLPDEDTVAELAEELGLEIQTDDNGDTYYAFPMNWEDADKTITSTTQNIDGEDVSVDISLFAYQETLSDDVFADVVSLEDGTLNIYCEEEEEIEGVELEIGKTKTEPEANAVIEISVAAGDDDDASTEGIQILLSLSDATVALLEEAGVDISSEFFETIESNTEDLSTIIIAGINTESDDPTTYDTVFEISITIPDQETVEEIAEEYGIELESDSTGSYYEFPVEFGEIDDELTGTISDTEYSRNAFQYIQGEDDLVDDDVVSLEDGYIRVYIDEDDDDTDTDDDDDTDTDDDDDTDTDDDGDTDTDDDGDTDTDDDGDTDTDEDGDTDTDEDDGDTDTDEDDGDTDTDEDNEETTDEDGNPINPDEDEDEDEEDELTIVLEDEDGDEIEPDDDGNVTVTEGDTVSVSTLLGDEELDNDDVEYSIDGDGATLNDDGTITFDEPGEVTITATYTDDDGNEYTTSVTVIVEEDENADNEDLEIEVTDEIGYYLSIDTRDFIEDLGLATVNGSTDDVTLSYDGEEYASPAELYEAVGEAYTDVELTVCYDGEEQEDYTVHVYIGVKGDADLDAEITISDASTVLAFYVDVAAGDDERTFDDDDELNTLIFMLSDIDGESTDASVVTDITISDASNILNFYVQFAAGNTDIEWPDIIDLDDLAEIEGSYWEWLDEQ